MGEAIASEEMSYPGINIRMAKLAPDLLEVGEEEMVLSPHKC